MFKRKVILKDGTEVLLRQPTLKDAKKLQKFNNDIVTEEVDIARLKKQSLQEIKKHIKEAISGYKIKTTVRIIAEYNNRIIGECGVTGFKKNKRAHTASLGMSVAKEYRIKGLGYALIKTVIELTKERMKNVELIYLEVTKRNKAAKKLYKKAGFKKVATLPRRFKYKGIYQDLEVMQLWLK